MTTLEAPVVAVHRFEVAPAPGRDDPVGEAAARDARALGLRVRAVRATHVYLIEAALDAGQVERVRGGLLADPVVEVARLGAAPTPPGHALVEVHPLPGVMDPVAQSVELAVRELVGAASRVRTGWRYDVEGVDAPAALELARRALANPVIHSVHDRPWRPASFPRAAAHASPVREVPLRGLDDESLARLSRSAHLFLSPEEMRALREHYRAMGREPREIELETLAQTWSEHCVHKTLKSTIHYRAASTPADPATTPAAAGPDPIDWTDRPGHTLNPDGSVTIRNLLKSTVAAATHRLIADGLDWALSVFVDNSGVVALDQEHGVCIKVETHNHPSAIEPYGGAATGIGGCIRDVMGTGLGAKPIASTDVFCVAPPDLAHVPEGCLPPRRVLTQVVAGVRDYGNRMGIPTVAGAVDFDERYVGNPLVFCGCVGLIPRWGLRGAARAGDRIVALGGRTGRDGIHGATFSSAELEHSASDEFAHAVQIGNAIEQKRLLDALLAARDQPDGPLYHAVTDCGAGGFSSAVGEMGAVLGAEVELDGAPLKYAGLSATEIWISEAQERMVLAVPPEKLERLRAVCAREGAEMADLGVFGTPGAELVLTFRGVEQGRLPMHVLHEGLPMPTRQAVWTSARAAAEAGPGAGAADGAPSADHAAALLALLASPAMASKHWIVGQYDHEVQGNTVIKPLVGPGGIGPGDASVIEPVPGSGRGIALACGLQTPVGDARWGGDPYLMALAAIDECVRNLVCVGADPSRIAILDNFCWPSCGKPENLAALVRACEGCYDGAVAYRTPFVSGKDSLNNQFTTRSGETIQIPFTLLITGLGLVPRLDRCVTMDAKQAGHRLLLVGPGAGASGAAGDGLGASAYARLLNRSGGAIGRVDLSAGPRCARAVAELIRRGLVRAAHDLSEGGLAVALAEMLIASARESDQAAAGPALGCELSLGALALAGAGGRGSSAGGSGGGGGAIASALFGEWPSRYLLEVAPEDEPGVGEVLADVPWAAVGVLDRSGRLRVPLADVDVPVDALRRAWRGTLDW